MEHSKRLPRFARNDRLEFSRMSHRIGAVSYQYPLGLFPHGYVFIFEKELMPKFALAKVLTT
jgi:hypothetical protein